MNMPDTRRFSKKQIGVFFLMESGIRDHEVIAEAVGRIVRAKKLAQTMNKRVVLWMSVVSSS